ncbi:hypothetical protein GA0070624_0475 [Micromonospora rhizosphaerae]|uniref:Copper(I)-binding protein n=1 Tax=Micromonospora rhizosphaerae TaxID=568872 RepID=A0A1C6RCA2_9ACTN|nr:hypothetical protein [Micromonospora rhizosphaerae]SCL14612.1 hypothetical protein GA0070624_0475 [Micromonospora rhizosphaerae]
MTRSIRGSRRAALLLAGSAAATSLLLSGCGAGQVAETSAKNPSVQGINVQTPDAGYKVRGLYVQYPGTEGYKAGSNAPINVVIYNDTHDPVTVTVTTDSAREILLSGSTPAGSEPSPSESATQIGSASPSPSESGASAAPSPSAPASPSASPSPSAPAGQPARIEIPALGYAQLSTTAGRFLQLVGLNEDLLSGQQVNLVFDFGNGKTLKTPAPIGVPLTPGAPASPIISREHGAEAGTEAGKGGSGHGG